jgi:serine/threonine-protein kinase
MNRNLQSSCDPVRLRDAVDGSLAPADRTELEQHLLTCDRCQKQIETIAGDVADWQIVKQSLSDGFIAPAGPSTSGIQAIVSAVGDPSAFPLQPELDQPTHPETLGSIDGFEGEQIIGRGGMGVVYRGFDKELNRPVAIKFLAPHLAANGVARKRFAREAQAAAAVVHPNVVPIHSVSPSPDRPYLVMALVHGRSLQKHVEDNGPLPVMDVVRIAQQIAAGLSAAHQQGLIHRDIKPANILLEKDVSRVMITDFGLARAADDAALTQSGWLAGTPHYMSPEQAKGDPIDRRSDLFSLGSVIFFMATGREPFRAEKSWAVLQKIGSAKSDSIRAINNQIPRPLEQIVEALMQKNPNRRIQTATEAHELLTEYLAHLQNPTGVRKPKPPRKPVQHSSKIRLGVLTAVLCVLGVLAVTQPWLKSPKTSGFGGTPTRIISRSAPVMAPTEYEPPAFVAQDQFQQQLNLLEQDIERLEAIEFGSRRHVEDSLPNQIRNFDNELRQLEQGQ